MDQVSATELKLYIENDGQLYDRHHVPIMKNLMARRARGSYDHRKSPKAFDYLVEVGARKYAHEFASPGDWSKIFPPAVRHETAKELADHFERRAGLGELDHLLPRPGSGPRRTRAVSSSRTGGRKTAAQLDGEIAQALNEKPGDGASSRGRTTDVTWFRFSNPGAPPVVGVVQGSGGVIRYNKEESTRRLRRQTKLAREGKPLDIYEPRRGHVRVFPHYDHGGRGERHVDVYLRRATFKVLATPGDRRPV